MQLLATSSPPSLKQTQEAADMMKEGKMRKACADFESFFLQQLLTAMRASVPKGGIIGGSFADDTFRSLQDETLAKHLAANRGMGIGEALYRKIQQQTGRTGATQRKTHVTA